MRWLRLTSTFNSLIWLRGQKLESKTCNSGWLTLPTTATFWVEILKCCTLGIRVTFGLSQPSFELYQSLKLDQGKPGLLVPLCIHKS